MGNVTTTENTTNTPAVAVSVKISIQFCFSVGRPHVLTEQKYKKYMYVDAQ